MHQMGLWRAVPEVFGSCVLQLRTAQEVSSWPCQMLLHADSVGPVMFSKVGHSGCHQKRFFFVFLMFCLPSEGIRYLLNILSSDLKKGCAQTSLSQLYQLVLYILVLPTFIFITAFLHMCFQRFLLCWSCQVSGWSLLHFKLSWVWSYRAEVALVCSSIYCYERMQRGDMCCLWHTECCFIVFHSWLPQLSWVAFGGELLEAFFKTKQQVLVFLSSLIPLCRHFPR